MKTRTLNKWAGYAIFVMTFILGSDLARLLISYITDTEFETDPLMLFAIPFAGAVGMLIIYKVVLKTELKMLR